MNLDRLIVHELKKDSGTTDTELILSHELIPIDDNSKELVETLLKSYQGDKILYAEFDNSPENIFLNNLKYIMSLKSTLTIL